MDAAEARVMADALAGDFRFAIAFHHKTS